MARSALDALPRWSWFLGLDPRTSALIIATLGIVHPMAYVYSCFLFRSYLFMTIWVLVAAWSAFSVALFIGIIQNEELAYEAWIWFTFVFVVLMTALMMMLLCAACRYTAPPCSIVVGLCGALYYCLSLYFVLVVNNQRLLAFPPRTPQAPRADPDWTLPWLKT